MKLLFVCLGNICRSPVAETIMKEKVSNKDVYIDSAGLISIHEGNSSDPRSIESAKNRGYHVTSKSRMISSEDFENFDYIIAMDPSNIKRLHELRPAHIDKNKILLMSDFLSTFQHSEIPDPYYGNSEDFELVIDLLEEATVELAKHLNI